MKASSLLKLFTVSISAAFGIGFLAVRYPENMPDNVEPKPAFARASDSSIREIRSRLFSGPISDIAAIDGLTIADMPEESQIGIHARFNHDPEAVRMLLSAAGYKWLRSDRGDWATEGLVSARNLDMNINLLVYAPGKMILDKNLSMRDIAEFWHYEMVVADINTYGDAIKSVQVHNEPAHFPKVEAKGANGRKRKISAWLHAFGGKPWEGQWVDKFAEFSAYASELTKADYPNIDVVIGALNINATATMIEEYDQTFDVVYFHPYPARRKPEFFPGLPNENYRNFNTEDIEFERTIDLFDEQVVFPRTQEKARFWVTEVGFSTYRKAIGVPDIPQPPTSEVMQGKLLARALNTYFAAGVERVFLFILNDTRSRNPARRSINNKESNFGLVRRDYSLKPAYLMMARINLLTRGIMKPDVELQRSTTIRSATTANGGALLEGERIRLVGFQTGIDRQMVSVWSDATTAESEDTFEPRQVTLSFDPSQLGSNPILFDVMTGQSRRLNPSVTEAGARVELEVPDYPLYIVEN
ncbi:MAG: hypothetical protein AAFX40_03000 [Cyanobacteria bacterium J06639_1]